MNMTVRTRQVGLVTIVDITGQIVRGEECPKAEKAMLLKFACLTSKRHHGITGVVHFSLC